MGILVSIINGLLLGAVYGVAAIGLTLIFGVMKVINLAHGAMIALGMFAVYLLSPELGLQPYLAVPVAGGLGFLLGVGVFWVAVRRVIGRAELMSLLATFAVSMVVVGLGTAALEHEPLQRPGAPARRPARRVHHPRQPHPRRGDRLGHRGGPLLLHELHPPGQGHPRRGQQPRGGRAHGHPLGADPGQRLRHRHRRRGHAAGGLIATLFPFTILSGGGYELKSFVVTVLGGLGNPAGALLGGLLLGCIEGAVSPFVPVSWTPVIEFSLFVLILVAFPAGLLRPRGGAD